MKRSIITTCIVIIGAVVVTTLSIDAADTLRGRSGTLLSSVISSKSDGCPVGMVKVPGASYVCVDIYEERTGLYCPTIEVQNTIDTRLDSEAGSCVPVSKADSVPWVYVTYHQAKELCAKVGKRLPTSEEWYTFSLGTQDTDSCNTHSTQLNASLDTTSACVNAFGVHDAIGNAWEWVDGVVKDGKYNEHILPASGYVVSANEHGLATITHPDTPNPDYHSDYFWSDKNGEFGMLRGGFYASGKDAGLYSVQAKTPLEQTSGAIGFRCVKDI